MTERTGNDRSNQVLLGNIEFGIGVLVFIGAFIALVYGDSSQDPRPSALYGLSSIVLMFTGLFLAIAGGGILRFRRWPYALHVPLALWSVFLVLAWL